MVVNMRTPMGVATEQTLANKLIYKRFLDAFALGATEGYRDAVSALFTSDARIHVAHPINETTGSAGYFGDVIAPMVRSFRGLHRRELILIGGEYQGGEWVASTGYFAGSFNEPWLGIPPNGRLAYVRVGEFHKMAGGRIVESYVFLGVAELIISLGLWPLSASQGYEGLVPGPATHDGIVLSPTDPERSRKTANLVDDMCSQLATPDKAWRPYWHPNMHWYGPGGFGTYVTVEDFEAFQVPFEQCFEGWGDGRADGVTTTGFRLQGGRWRLCLPQRLADDHRCSRQAVPRHRADGQTRVHARLRLVAL